MIKLVVGLGNPGRQYEKNRHNAGFLFLDHLSGVSSWNSEAKFHGIIANYHAGAGKVILLKPQTFMNKSGLSVGAIARYYKIDAEEILVVHDELDLSSGVARLKMGGGHAGHNGLRDIIESLGKKDFYRLRVGIGRPKSGKKVADFVLSDLSRLEMEEMLAAFGLADAYFDKVIGGEVALAMNGLNKK